MMTRKTQVLAPSSIYPNRGDSEIPRVRNEHFVADRYIVSEQAELGSTEVDVVEIHVRAWAGGV